MVSEGSGEWTKADTCWKQDATWKKEPARGNFPVFEVLVWGQSTEKHEVAKMQQKPTTLKNGFNNLGAESAVTLQRGWNPETDSQRRACTNSEYEPWWHLYWPLKHTCEVATKCFPAKAERTQLRFEWLPIIGETKFTVWVESSQLPATTKISAHFWGVKQNQSP